MKTDTFSPTTSRALSFEVENGVSLTRSKLNFQLIYYAAKFDIDEVKEIEPRSGFDDLVLCVPLEEGHSI